eukprot:2392565-Rhodomonas_salina.2
MVSSWRVLWPTRAAARSALDAPGDAHSAAMHSAVEGCKARLTCEGAVRIQTRSSTPSTRQHAPTPCSSCATPPALCRRGTAESLVLRAAVLAGSNEAVRMHSAGSNVDGGGTAQAGLGVAHATLPRMVPTP